MARLCAHVHSTFIIFYFFVNLHIFRCKMLCVCVPLCLYQTQLFKSSTSNSSSSTQEEFTFVIVHHFQWNLVWFLQRYQYFNLHNSPTYNKTWWQTLSSYNVQLIPFMKHSFILKPSHRLVIGIKWKFCCTTEAIYFRDKWFICYFKKLDRFGRK